MRPDPYLGLRPCVLTPLCTVLAVLRAGELEARGAATRERESKLVAAAGKRPGSDLMKPFSPRTVNVSENSDSRMTLVVLPR